VNEPSAEKV